MKLRSAVLGVLSALFALATSSAHADPMGDLCAIFTTERNATATLQRAIANEQNPLKKDSLQRQYAQIGQQKQASLDNYLRVNQFRIKNFTGVVSAFRSFSYFQGPGVDLAIDLPCKVTIGFRFLDARPEIGPPQPEQFASLSSWKPALENIVVNDTVIFSGRFTLGGSGLAGVLTELKKGGGAAYNVADPIAKPRVSHGGMTWTAVTFAESWLKANAYCADLNVNGETGWRMPTQGELENMLRSGATNGKGWMTGAAWTSTPWPSNGNGWYSMVNLQNGPTYSAFQTERNGVSCVRASASAQAIPPLTARVTDLTPTLSSDERAVLEQKIAAFNNRKGAQIAVLIVPTTQPETLDQYTTRVSEAWKLGRKGANNGVLLLVAKNDSRLRIEIDHGLEGALNDATAKRIIEDNIIPKFRSGDFFGGISGGVAAIITHLEGKDVASPK